MLVFTKFGLTINETNRWLRFLLGLLQFYSAGGAYETDIYSLPCRLAFEYENEPDEGLAERFSAVRADIRPYSGSAAPSTVFILLALSGSRQDLFSGVPIKYIAASSWS